jgi:hypothetical protein
MAATKSTVPGGERRRKPRGAGAVATASGPADGEWLGRLDDLAGRLAALDDRGTIVEQVVSETMKLLPADEVRIHAEAPAEVTTSFTEETDGVPARLMIPLAIAGRHFGAIEIAIKPSRVVGPGERALGVSLARHCALALDRLALRRAQRQASQDDVTPLTAEPPVASAAMASAPVAPPAPLAADASASVFAAGLSPDLGEAQVILGRLEGDLRALAKLARSAELPPTAWVDRAEQTALRRLEDLRAQLLGVAHAA